MRSGAAAVACALALTSCSSLRATGTPDSGTRGSTTPGSTPVPAGPASIVPLADSSVVLDFDGLDPLATSREGVTGQARAEGDAGVRTIVSGDGTRGLVFPRWSETDEHRLVLVITPQAAASAPRPGNGLTFGADVRLDAGPTAGGNDNGNNVVQRGLYTDLEQYKLQVDKRVPSCTVRTPAGRVEASSDHALGDGWYRIGCQYDGVELTLAASDLGAGAAVPTTVRTRAPLGPLSFPGTTDVAVGGKVDARGRLVRTQPDQFNGALDNVFVSPAP